MPDKPGCVRRLVRFSRWLAPALLYALIPKCPVCLAAYLALFTGAAVPLATAQLLRTALLVLCGASIATLVVMKFWRHRASRSTALTPTAAAS